MDSSKIRETYFIEKDNVEYLTKLAITYGFSSFTNAFQEFVNGSNIFESDIDKIDYSNFFKVCHEKKKEYFSTFDKELKKFYKNEDEKLILRKAHFYYTSKENELLINPKIKERSKLLNKFTNARNTIKELFILDELESIDYEEILNRIDASIIHVTNTKGNNIKEFNKKMNNELDRLKLTTYKREEILSIFKHSL